LSFRAAGKKKETLRSVHICILLLAEDRSEEDEKQPVLFAVFHTCA